MKQSDVGVIKTSKKKYPEFPFGPNKRLEEFDDFIYEIKKQEDSFLYDDVRKLFFQMGLDKENFGKKKWNPFKGIIKKGDNIVIKPNLVFDKHPLGENGVEAMITHASVIRPIIDYVLLVTKGNCKITICDVSLQSTDWKKLIDENGYNDLVSFYSKKGIKIDLLDLRYEIALPDNEGHYYKKIKKIRDPKGYVSVDLGEKSYMQEIVADYKKLEITDYSLGVVSKHHNPKRNEYLLSKTILNADVFINVPKLKTHRKAGMTLAMKNLIGINGDKSWIAHHRRGIDEYDEFRLKEFLKWRFNYYLKIYTPNFVNNFVRKIYRIVSLKGKSIKEHGMLHGGSKMEGNWYGNDTIWRAILDLNNIMLFADKNGKMRDKQQRKYIAIVDGIMGMEKEGPMDGYPKNSKLLIGGFNPVSVDYVGCYLMGFDWNKIKSIKNGFANKFWKLTNFDEKSIEVESNVNWKNINLKFKASSGWKSKIER